MTSDQEHLNLLSIFHFVLAGLTALFSCMFLMHVFIGLALVFGEVDDPEFPSRVFGWLFVIVPSLFILAGWTLAGLMVATGRKLRGYRSPTFCQVVAGIECLLMPFGTILGVFTLVVLNRESVKALFRATPSNTPPGKGPGGGL